MSRSPHRRAAVAGALGQRREGECLVVQISASLSVMRPGTRVGPMI